MIINSTQSNRAANEYAGNPVASRADFRVALVSMPFVSYNRPSIQLGLLKSIAEAQGFPVTTFHLNLDFAKQIGPTLYSIFSEFRGQLIGDWLFARAAFGEETPPEEGFLSLQSGPENSLEKKVLEEGKSLAELRNQEVPAYLQRMLETIDWGQFKVIGFTSTFQQNCASFALASSIKRRYPHVITVFGGANFEGEMGVELTRTIDCIDYAVIGEGDKAFPEFLMALQEGRDPAQVPGVVCRRDGQVTPLRARPPLKTLDELPAPDYVEYFERATKLGLLPDETEGAPIMLPFESSRGCWWGQKHQCTFCGLNGKGIVYRSKSPEKVLDELATLKSYRKKVLMEAVDNILDMSYLQTLFKKVIQEKPGYKFFYEVKANLRRDQVRLLHQGGVFSIQPGIESLNTHVLKLMRKGITASQNVNLMRWARFYGMHVGWNMLWGFPGETEDDYQEQATLVSNLIHLMPPTGYGRIWMERYSPIFFERDNFPTRFIRPEKSYSYIYPETVDLEKIAYFFDYEFEESLPEATYKKLAEEIDRWMAAWENSEEKPRLLYWAYPGFLQIEDLRDPQQARSITLEEPEASVYLAFSDRPHTALTAKTSFDLKYPVSDLEKLLAKYCEAGLMMKDGPYYLSLAIPGVKSRPIIRNGRFYLSFSPEPQAEEAPERELALAL